MTEAIPDTSLRRIYTILQIPPEAQQLLSNEPYSIHQYGDLLKLREGERNDVDGNEHTQSTSNSNMILDDNIKRCLLRVVDFMVDNGSSTDSSKKLKPFTTAEFVAFLKRSTYGDTGIHVGFGNLLIKLGFTDRLISIIDEIGITDEKTLVSQHDSIKDRINSYRNFKDIQGDDFDDEVDQLIALSSFLKTNMSFSMTEFKEYLLERNICYILDKAKDRALKAAQRNGSYEEDVINNMFDHHRCHSILRRFVQQLSLDPAMAVDSECIVYGPTQVGKTHVKATAAWTCFDLKIPCVVVTKGKESHYNLLQKFDSKHFLNAATARDFTSSEFTKRNPKVKKLIHHMMNGGTLVVYNTKMQLERARQLVIWCVQDSSRKPNKYRDLTIMKRSKQSKACSDFCLIVDEADDFLRTMLGSEKTSMEKEYNRLQNLGPRIKIHVTATPLPLFKHFDNMNKHVDVLPIIPSDDYLGIGDLQTFKDPHGDDVFLSPGELKEGYNVGDRFIPGTSRTTIQFYEDAVTDGRSDTEAKKGVLVCDISLHLVYVDGNIVEKAKEVQALFADRKQHIAIVICVGEGIFFKLGGNSSGSDNGIDDGNSYGNLSSSKMYCSPKDWILSDVLNLIDERCGLATPIFVFGCTTLNRGVSVRSDERVVTHIQVGLGNGHSVGSLVQAMGRATGNNKGVLQENLGPHARPKVLTTKEDWKSAKKYVDGVEHEVHERANASDELQAGGTTRMNYESVFLSRPLGQERKRSVHHRTKKRKISPSSFKTITDQEMAVIVGKAENGIRS